MNSVRSASPWRVTGPAEEEYASRGHLAAALSRLVMSDRSLTYFGPIDFLNGLAKLGVNPDQLVTVAELSRQHL
ncbi:MAG TPA: hypothetical protein VFQ44_01860 [Streptosporangiaceae bacterium]|nr:hypothetical protein [Streptosporangiaceae bacterium]